MSIGWKTRVGLMLSAVWLILAILIADDDHRIGQVLGIGFLPLVIIWGVVWVVIGWRAQRKPKPGMAKVGDLEAKRKRSLRLRAVLSVFAILAIGLFSAVWQFRAVDNGAAGNAVAYWFGEWLVYGIFSFVVFRLIRQIPPGLPIVLAAIVVVGGVNYKAHSTITEDREALISLAKAAPFINKMQSGAQVADQEIRDAKVGMMEPLLLVQAGYSREIIAFSAAYTKAISQLQPELMLTPISLASPNTRVQTRAKLKVAQQAAVDYKNKLDAATSRAKLAMQAAQIQMPSALAKGALKGFDESSIQISTYTSSLVHSEQEVSGTINAVLDLMDANPTSYSVDKGPPATLLFSDEAILTRYRQLMDAVAAAGQRETDAQALLLKAQADRTERLADLLKR